MKTQPMVKAAIILLFLFNLTDVKAQGRRCSGTSVCIACSGCKNCNNYGGSCGVCGGGESYKIKNSKLRKRSYGSERRDNKSELLKLPLERLKQ